jgi:Fe-S-cluster containining protein
MRWTGIFGFSGRWCQRVVRRIDDSSALAFALVNGGIRTSFASAMPSAIHYRCQRCTNCCRWPGFVPVGDAEITAIAQHLGLSESDFIQRYTRLRRQRDGLALTDKPNGECIFLEGRDCAIQPVKPVQCAGFPNTWNFPGWREVCEAVPTFADHDA